MSARAATPASGIVAPPRKLTVEDVRRKAERVQDAAREDAERVKRQVMSTGTTRVVIYAAVGVAVAVGLAYYMGNRAAKQALRAAAEPS